MPNIGSPFQRSATAVQLDGLSLVRHLAIAGLLAVAGPSIAQQVQELDIRSVPPDLLHASDGSEVSPGAGPSGAHSGPVDLGENLPASSTAGTAGTASPGGTHSGGSLLPAQRAALAAQTEAAGGKTQARPTLRRAARSATGVERAVFRNAPVQVNLQVGQERLITLPAPAALSVPNDMEHVARMEIIGPTLYVTALTPFHRIRIVAELIDSGQQIPMDFVAGAGAQGQLAELEVSVLTNAGQRGADAGADAGAAAGSAEDAAPAQPSVDMVQLTRHAAQQLYAPRRLAWATPGVHQVEVLLAPVPALIRGVQADVAPLGQWKSGPLYVTAVRVTNRSQFPMEIPLEQLRGRWLAATPQHGRIGPAGSDTDTTAIYLVCDRPFAACLQ